MSDMAPQWFTLQSWQVNQANLTWVLTVPEAGAVRVVPTALVSPPARKR